MRSSEKFLTLAQIWDLPIGSIVYREIKEGDWSTFVRYEILKKETSDYMHLYPLVGGYNLEKKYLTLIDDNGTTLRFTNALWINSEIGYIITKHWKNSLVFVSEIFVKEYIGNWEKQLINSYLAQFEQKNLTREILSNVQNVKYDKELIYGNQNLVKYSTHRLVKIFND